MAVESREESEVSQGALSLMRAMSVTVELWTVWRDSKWLRTRLVRKRRTSCRVTGGEPPYSISVKAVSLPYAVDGPCTSAWTTDATTISNMLAKVTSTWQAMAKGARAANLGDTQRAHDADGLHPAACVVLLRWTRDGRLIKQPEHEQEHIGDGWQQRDEVHCKPI